MHPRDAANAIASPSDTIKNKTKAIRSMPVTQCAVIYSTGNAHIRRIVSPDHDDSELQNRNIVPVGANESIVLMSAGPYADTDALLAAAANAVTTAAGKATGNPRCAVIDGTGTVIGVIMADAAIDTMPGMTLANHPDVNVGDTFATGVFTRPGFVTGKGITVQPVTLPIVTVT